MEKIFEARTEREAVENAVRTFGVNEEYIEIKIINKKKGNFLGLNSKVTIKASVIGIPQTDTTDIEEQYDPTQDTHTSLSDSEYAPHSTHTNTAAAHAVPLTPLTEHQKKETAAIIEAITSKMNIDVDVEFHSIDNQLFASLIIEDVSDQNLLIGKHGKNIDALQVIVNSILQKRYDTPLEKVVIEIENYRNKRNNWLTELAQRKAEQVLKSKRSYTLEEMNPYDRKRIHSAIKNIPGVSTESIGNGYYKRLTIYSV